MATNIDAVLFKKSGLPAVGVAPDEFSRWIWGVGPRDQAAKKFYDERERFVKFVVGCTNQLFPLTSMVDILATGTLLSGPAT